jgi:hypothetical protein
MAYQEAAEEEGCDQGLDAMTSLSMVLINWMKMDMNWPSTMDGSPFGY